MSHSYYFTLKHIPDFSLSKYVSGRSQAEIFEKNQIFIRQLHGLGKTYGIHFHLYYIFSPEKTDSRFNVVLECVCVEENIGAEELYNIISSFAIFEVYAIKYVDDCKKIFGEHLYKYCTAMYKKQIYTAPNYTDLAESEKKCYYSISEWKMKKNSRFFNTLSLMGKLKHSLILRIDAICVKDSGKIIRDINKKGIYRNIKDRASLTASIDSNAAFARDEAAENIARYYEKYMVEMQSQLQFEAAVCVLSDFPDDGNMLIDTLVAEVIENGLTENDYFSVDKFDEDGFRHDFLLDSPVSYDNDNIFDNQKVWYMRSLYTSNELSAFFAFPYVNSGERLDIRKETDPVLDNNIEKSITLGVIYDNSEHNRNLMDVKIPINNLCKHGYICGVPGSGKTYTMKHIIHSLNRNSVPFLVFEPAKKEYRELFMVNAKMKKTEYGEFTDRDKTSNIQLFSLCANTMFPFHINPLEIPNGVSVSEYISTLYNVFMGAFFWPSPSHMILYRALELAYAKKGLLGNIKIKTSDIKADMPDISDLYECFKTAMDEYSFVGEMRSNITGILESRIGTLASGYMGEIFNIGYSSIPPENWLSSSIIMELEALPTEHANFVSLLILSLIRLYLKKSTIDGNKLRHVIFFEEAHNLIGPCAVENNSENASAKLAATIMIKNMLAEVRAYNEGIIIADQLPSALAPEVLKNTSLKIAHRQLSADERKAIAAVMSADSLQIERMAQFSKGRALVIYEDDNLIKPFDMQVVTQFNYSGDSTSDSQVIEKVISEVWYIDSVLCSIDAKVRRCFAMITDLEDEFCNILEAKGSYNTDQYLAQLLKKRTEMNAVINILTGIANVYNILESFRDLLSQSQKNSNAVVYENFLFVQKKAVYLSLDIETEVNKKCAGRNLNGRNN